VHDLRIEWYKDCESLQAKWCSIGRECLEDNEAKYNKLATLWVDLGGSNL